MHNPQNRPCVELADYYELAEGEEPRNGFVCLAPGTSIAVSSLWLQKLLASIPKKKSRKNIKSPQRPIGFDIIKRLIDGFYEPWHLNVGGGTAGFRDTPVFKSLRRYAEHKLNMSQSTFNRAWLEKMSSAKSTIKRIGQDQLHQLMTGNLTPFSQ